MPILFPAPEGGYLRLDTWRKREWYPALEAAGLPRRSPYHLRHTYATEQLAGGVSVHDLARIMETSLREIDRTHGHLACDSFASILARQEAGTAANRRRSGVVVASDQKPPGRG